MKELLQLLSLVLAVLWVPVTSHCAWENVLASQFFKCAPSDSQQGDCEDDTCAQLENGSYRISNPQVALPAPVLTVLFQVLFDEPVAGEESVLATAPPPEIPAGWQFSFRTALSPRAPSFVS